jgi:5'-methylthioadenosine phosphorylase
MQAEIGIIGGTGLETPYGPPSDAITVGELAGICVAFIPRHGKRHTIRPTDVNSRANIFALKKLGVTRILGSSTVGSLREEYKPGDVVFVDQFIDRTTKREQSFYSENKVCHISVAEPMCPELRELISAVAKKEKISAHETGTYVCIEGPRFSTKAESKMFRMWGADIVGMTLVPECVLAREAEICYASVAMVTDYDVWKDHPVCVDDIVKTMRANIENVKRIIAEAVVKIPKERGCECKSALKSALV